MSARRERLRRRARNRSPMRVVLLAVAVVAVLSGLGVLAAVGWVVSVATSAPPIERLKPIQPGQSSAVYAADGSRLGFIQANILRTPIPSGQIPQTVKDATVAIEDERFYDHRGVDFEGVVRAAIKNLESGRTVEGGSTLTMQLVRTLYISRERTFQRKIREAKLAEELENIHDKKWILNKYINSVPYGTVGGQTAVGIQAGARVFFNKPASKLELHEAALLAGLPQAPSRYNPIRSTELALERRNRVLDKMAELRMIQPQTAQEAKQRPLDVEPGRFYTERRESYFFDYVKQTLIDEYGLEVVRKGGLKVHTTLDLKMQRAARKAINDRLSFGNAPSGAIVTIEPKTGYIRAMASNAKYGKRKFNLAAQGKRQAGSTFKVMGLVAALDRGISPESTVYTSKRLKFRDPKWGPIDVDCYAGCAGRSMNLVQATLRSDNAVYQQLALDIGPEAVKEAARKMGITSKLNGYPSEILGGLERGVSPLEMTRAYATLAAGGMRPKMIAVTKVRFPDGRVDQKLGKTSSHRAFADGVTGKVTDILKRNVTGGTGTSAQIGCPAAGKTGTVDEHVDAWFVGYTPNLATAVWVGYPDKRVSMLPPTTPIRVAGGTYPAEIWGDYMKRVKKGCADFPQPKQAFQAAPFFGKYARTGAPGAVTGYGTNGGGAGSYGQGYAPAPSTGGGSQPAEGDTSAPPSGGGGNRSGGGGSSEFPSDLYESPPQSAPSTGNGGGNGNGGAGGGGGGAAAPPGR